MALIFIVGGLFVNWHLKQIEKGFDVNLAGNDTAAHKVSFAGAGDRVLLV